MRPFLLEGMQVRVRAVRPDELCLGDVVLAEAGEVTLLHRLVGRRGDLFVLRGDSRSAPEFVRGAEVLGRVEAIRIAGRWIPLGVRLRLGWAAMAKAGRWAFWGAAALQRK